MMMTCHALHYEIISPEGCIPNLRSLMKLFSLEHALLAALQVFQGLFLWFSLVRTKITLTNGPVKSLSDLLSF